MSDRSSLLVVSVMLSSPFGDPIALAIVFLALKHPTAFATLARWTPGRLDHAGRPIIDL